MALTGIETEYIWLGIFVIGFAILMLAVFRKTSKIKIPQAPGAIIGGLMMLVGYMWGVAPLFSESAPFETQRLEVSTVSTLPPPTFAIEPSTVITNIWDSPAGDVITTQALDASETVFTVPVDYNAGGAVSYEFAVNFTAMNFTVTPIPPDGATADALATIYFETDYNIKHSGEYVFEHDGNEAIFFANWTRVGTVGDAPSWDHAGQDTMLYTEDEIYQVAYKFDSGAGNFAEEFNTIGETVTWHITFHNSDWSWSKIYTVNAIVIDAT